MSRSVMSHNFSQIPQVEIPRSSFNRSHGYKTTFDSGYLVPIYMDEALPGDTFRVRMSAFARMSTPKYPVMDNMYLDTFFFAVPIRLLWSNFKKMMGEQANPADSTTYLVPKITSTGTTGYSVGSLHDYFGIPTGIPDLDHSALWHRAYNLIYNEWFRDENLQNSVTINTGDGPDAPTDYTLLKRGKRHDYFTSALPWPQKGTAVQVPLGDKAYVKGIGKYNTNWTAGALNVYESNQTGVTTYQAYKGIDAPVDNQFYVEKLPGSSPAVPNIYADLSTATAATINQLRQAFQLQRMYERDARGGTRYTEIIRSHFGVVSPDARLQRPEYLGGGSVPINIHPVAQTATGGTYGVGALAAFGTVSAQGHGFTKSFTEHCVLLGLANVRADLSYQQGLDRMWSRRTRFDFYWPALSHIGEQTILNKEIYAQGSLAATDSGIFGYQERYAEYRYKNSLITGKFRSTASGTLDSWHLAQKFTALPALNSTFIQDSPPVDRVVVVSSEPQFLFDSYFDVQCARPMPVYGVPGLIDHF